MAEPSSSKLNLPPFPPLRWNEFSWAGKTKLKSWAGFQCRQGAYTSQSSDEPSDGAVTINVIPSERSADVPPSAEQVNAFRYLVEHEDVIRDAVIAAILEEYPRLRQNFFANGFGEDIPVIERPEQLKDHIGLGIVHILPVVKDGAAYIGFEFGCTWDEEHGLGLMTHQGRVVEMGMGIGKIAGADIASEEWVAEADADGSE
jgi:Domain of unknown function (DUF6985)